MAGWFKNEREDNRWFAAINFCSAQATLRRLDKAFSNFFRRVKAGEEPRYPRFKSADRFNSVLFPSTETGFDSKGTNSAYNTSGRSAYACTVRLRKRSRLLAFKREADRWFVVVACEVPEPVKVANVLPAIGLDVGLTQFATTSDGEKIANPRFLKSDLPELRRAQRSLSCKKKGGRNRAKQRRKVNRLHARVANLRREHRHKVSNDRISRYGRIAVESLNVQGMIRNHRLARAISDVASQGRIRIGERVQPTSWERCGRTRSRSGSKKRFS